MERAENKLVRFYNILARVLHLQILLEKIAQEYRMLAIADASVRARIQKISHKIDKLNYYMNAIKKEIEHINLKQ